MAFFITHLTGTSRLFRGFAAKEEFRRPGSAQQLRWAMKNALVAAPPVWLKDFPPFSSPC
jgi:hypothetical protein